MKRSVLVATVAIAVIALAATMGMAYGQGGPGQGPGRGHGHGFGHGGGPGGPPPIGMMIQHMATELALTDAQKASIDQIITEEQAGDQAAFEKDKAIHDQLRALGTDGAFDEAKVRELAGQLTAGMTERIVSRERTKAKVFAVLTPDQRAKVVARMQQGPMGKRGPGAPPAQ